MKMPTQKQLEAMREMYPEGTAVKLLAMDDKFAPPVGTLGLVTHVDDIGQIHVNWQNGSSLALIPDADSFCNVNAIKIICYGKTQLWEDRIAAMQEYYEGAMVCEGSERDRYLTIYNQLSEGKMVCTDEV